MGACEVRTSLEKTSDVTSTTYPTQIVFPKVSSFEVRSRLSREVIDVYNSLDNICFQSRLVRGLVQGVRSEVVQVEAIVYKVSVYSVATPQGGRA